MPVPNEHVAHALERPELTAAMVPHLAELADDLPCNFITSVSGIASQTVFHLHWHLVPRRADDGLMLPWSAGVAAGPQATPPEVLAEVKTEAPSPMSRWKGRSRLPEQFLDTEPGTSVLVVAAPTSQEDQP